MSSGISRREDSNRECWLAGIINFYEEAEHHSGRTPGKLQHATGDHPSQVFHCIILISDGNGRARIGQEECRARTIFKIDFELGLALMNGFSLCSPLNPAEAAIKYQSRSAGDLEPRKKEQQMLLSVCYPFFRFYSGLLAAHVRTTARILLAGIQSRFTIASLIR
jgi:hypothetical protein